MLDHAQSIVLVFPEVARGALAPAAAELEADPSPLVAKPPARAVVVDEPLVSIRFAQARGLCAACEKRETGVGPIGYFDEDPVCDLCLLERSHDLGLVLALALVTRAYATSDHGSPEEHQEALAELGAFARVYERVAAKSWPARVIRLFPGFATGPTAH